MADRELSASEFVQGTLSENFDISSKAITKDEPSSKAVVQFFPKALILPNNGGSTIDLDREPGGSPKIIIRL